MLAALFPRRVYLCWADGPPRCNGVFKRLGLIKVVLYSSVERYRHLHAACLTFLPGLGVHLDSRVCVSVHLMWPWLAGEVYLKRSCVYPEVERYSISETLKPFVHVICLITSYQQTLEIRFTVQILGERSVRIYFIIYLSLSYFNHSPSHVSGGISSSRERDKNEGKGFSGEWIKNSPKTTEIRASRWWNTYTNTRSHTCGVNERGKWRRPFGRRQQSQAIGLLSPVNPSSTISVCLSLWLITGILGCSSTGLVTVFVCGVGLGRSRHPPLAPIWSLSLLYSFWDCSRSQGQSQIELSLPYTQAHTVVLFTDCLMCSQRAQV